MRFLTFVAPPPRNTGWRVRLLTFDGPTEAPGEGQLRKAWSLDKKTVLLQYDPSAPNLMAFPYM